jgi:hypothetical protein
VTIAYFLYTRSDAPIRLTAEDVAVMKAYVAAKGGIVVGEPLPDTPPQFPIWYKMLGRTDVQVVLCARGEDFEPGGLKMVRERVIALRKAGKYLDFVPATAGSDVALRTVGEWLKPGPNGLVWVDRAQMVVELLDYTARQQSRALGRRISKTMRASQAAGARIGRPADCLCGHPAMSKGMGIHGDIGKGRCMLCDCPAYRPPLKVAPPVPVA